MACLGIRCGGNSPAFIRNPRFSNHQSYPISGFSHSLSSSIFSNHAMKVPPQRISASTNTFSSHPPPPPPVLSSSRFDYLQPCHNNTNNNKLVKIEECDRQVESRVSEKLDEWLRDSVVDIVKNLKQAPLLVQIYANNNGSTMVKTDKAVAEDWPDFMMREKPSPDGIILVEELEEEGIKDLEEEDGTRAWGLLIQGKAEERECGSACYLLKTSRVCGGLGLSCSTHFCLMKVQSFRESALSQLSHCWLFQ